MSDWVQVGNFPHVKMQFRDNRESLRIKCFGCGQHMDAGLTLEDVQSRVNFRKKHEKCRGNATGVDDAKA